MSGTAERPPQEQPAVDLMEIRVHGRGGQGGVTCAKILAAVYGRLGDDVQSFGDYAGERSGAPVRAYVRVSSEPITNRNKVYEPNHLLVLDPTLLGAEVLSGLEPGGTLLVNTPGPASEFGPKFDAYRLATVDATAIARKHRIGTKSVVIVNTTIAGAFLRAMAIPFNVLEDVYRHLGLLSNLPAAAEAYESVRLRAPVAVLIASRAEIPRAGRVAELVEGLEGAPPRLRTGNWRTQTPKYVHNLAPCSAFCPAGNDVIGFVQALAKKGEPEAASLLSASTPLAGVCGRVCPAPCMDGCNRAEMDGPVNIRSLERWVADHPTSSSPVTPEPARNRRRFTIVGSGPAGLSAAYQLAKAGHAVRILEAESALGGVLRTGIPAYRLPREIVDREIGDVLALGVEATCGVRVGPADVARLARESDGVLLATGLQRLRKAGVPNDGLTGIEQGIAFLHRVNMTGDVRVSGHVVVLGGGNTAMDCARSALRAGAAKVTIAYRRTREEMPAIREEIDEALAEGITLLLQRAPVGFGGDGGVADVVLAEVELGEPDESGRRAPVLTDRREILKCDRVLLALGQSADFSLVPEGWRLTDGRFRDAEGYETKVFAAGDVATGDGTVTHAIGDGRRAAGRLLAAAGEAAVPWTRPDRSLVVAATEIRFDHFVPADPTAEPHLPAAVRIGSWDEVHLGLPSQLEAHRCFSCGECTRCDTCLVYCPEGIIRRREMDYEIDYSYCKGCGICVAECPRSALTMEAVK